MEILVAIIIFLCLIMIGVPIAWVLGLTTLGTLAVSGNPNWFLMFTPISFSAADNFTMLAVPLYVLVGEVMIRSGVAKRLVSFSMAMLGHIRGGLGYVNILASMFLASCMGSSAAEAAVMCPIMVEPMEKAGYEKDFAAALTAAASIMGPVIPPSMVFIVYGVIANVSIGAMFIAGIIPGILLGISFALINFWYARKHKLVTVARGNIKQISFSLLEAIPSLMVPVIIMGGIFTGFYTTTESAVGAAAYSAILGFIYRELKVKDLVGIFLRTGIVSASIVVITSTAYTFGWVTAMLNVPDILAKFLSTITTNQILLLLILNGLFLFIGCVMEGIAAMNILVPVIVPVAVGFGIDPLHLGMVITINLIIGLITPPVGLSLFVTSSVTGISIEKISRQLIPFIVSSAIILLLIILIPDLVLLLPKMVLR